MLREKQALPIRGLLPIVLTSFFFNLAYTLLSPVYPIFVKSLLSQDAYVGYFVAFMAMLMIIYGFLIEFILEKYKKISVLKLGLLGLTITFFLLAFIKSIYFLIPLEIFRTFFLTMVLVPTALLVRDVANKKNLGKTEGFYFTIANLAWMIGPLLGGLLAHAHGFQKLFMISALFPFISFIILAYKHPIEHNHTHPRTNLFLNIKDFVKCRVLVFLALLSMGLLFWWSMIYTFLPLFMKDSGFSVEIIGIVLFLVVLPLILLEFPAGNLADKLGFKKFFFIGFLIMAALAISTYFISSPLTVIILIILGSIGAAFIEPLREAYFFEIVNKKDEMRLYPVHRVAVPLGQLTGPLIFSTVLLLSNFKFLFLFIGMLMFIFSLISLFIKEVK